MLARFPIAICFTVILSSLTFAAAPVVEPTGMWTGKIKDESLRKLAPQSGFFTDAKTWKKLWTAWRPGEELPKVDFAKELILVGTVPGPNLVIMRPTIDDSGDVKFIVGGTKIGGPGFGYKLIKIGRDGVKTVNGKTLTSAAEESITVNVVGTLRTGVVAIGGETTGTTITAKGITWELEFGKNAAFRKAAEKLSGKKVIVQGSLERRRGVEIKERWIVTVTALQGAGDAKVGCIEKPDFHAILSRTNSRIRCVSEGGKLVFEIKSESGIDRARIKRLTDTWPMAILVRLNLSGLESFRAGNGKVTVEWSASSTGDNASRVSLRRGNEEVALDQRSPYHTPVRIVGGNGKIPLKDGYFEVPLPAKLFERNPEEITLRWVDFYRN